MAGPPEQNYEFVLNTKEMSNQYLQYLSLIKKKLSPMNLPGVGQIGLSNPLYSTWVHGGV